MGRYSIIDLAIVDIKLTLGTLLLRYNVFIVRNRLEDWTIASVMFTPKEQSGKLKKVLQKTNCIVLVFMTTFW